ncbi:hypothetical protein HID58_074865 [Brassica napus]|uniref:Uncharacterized protein n=1 Tax=Brassica napus TaxID=3708 RepID=A0ABQ7YI18_BRANA|nr:hypothetical protein HID58_074865 [Brassica napus]
MSFYFDTTIPAIEAFTERLKGLQGEMSTHDKHRHLLPTLVVFPARRRKLMTRIYLLRKRRIGS